MWCRSVPEAMIYEAAVVEVEEVYIYIGEGFLEGSALVAGIN